MRTIILICFFSVFLVTFQIGFTQDKILNIELKNVSNPINLTISYQYTNFLDDDYYFNRDTTVKLLFNLMGEVNNKPLYTIKISDNNIFKVIYNYRDIRQSGLSVSIDFDSVYKSAEEINVLNKELYEEKYKLFSIDAENLNTEIDKKIKNKSFNKIGDILYDLDYIRQPLNGSVIGYQYIKFYYYDNVKYSNYIIHTVKVWYSYGYGNLYYSIESAVVFTVNGKEYRFYFKV